MGLGVVYESVETEEQRARLLELGFDFAQGYFIAKHAPEGGGRGTSGVP